MRKKCNLRLSQSEFMCVSLSINLRALNTSLVFIHSFAASRQTLSRFVRRNCFAFGHCFRDLRYEISQPSNLYIGLPLVQFFPFCVAILISFGLRKPCRYELVQASRLSARAYSQTSIQPYSGLCLSTRCGRYNN